MNHNMVFLIDDDPFVTDQQEYEVRKHKLNQYLLTFENPDEAIQVLRDYKSNGKNFPSFILLDLNLDGFSATDFLERFVVNFPYESQTSKIIIITGARNYRERKKAASYPVVKAILNKPIPIDLTRDLIDYPG